MKSSPHCLPSLAVALALTPVLHAGTFPHTFPQGISIFANPLNNGIGNSLADIFPNPPPGTRVTKFNNGAQTYNTSHFDQFDLVWSQPLTLSPGEGAFLQTY